jgi:AraC-like DNA-binding protein
MSAAHRLVRGVARYLDESYAKEIVLEELSAQFYVSKYYLCHSFHEVTGTGVVDYLQCRRVLEAQKLLMQGCDVRQTAERCGFHTMQHFYRVFKRVTGTSPGAYRLPTGE